MGKWSATNSIEALCQSKKTDQQRIKVVNAGVDQGFFEGGGGFAGTLGLQNQKAC